MSFIAVGIGSGVALAGGIMASNATGKAADTQAGAANYATDMQKRMYDQNRTDLTPWREAGGRALSQLGDSDFQHDFTIDDFHEDPGYQFRMQEGQRALDRSAASRGRLNSGGTLIAAEQYGQNFGSNEYQNAYKRFNDDRDRRFNRLSAVAGIGQTANNQAAQSGQNYVNNAGQNAMGAANAQGAAGVAQAGIWGNTLGSLGKTWMDYTMMNKMGAGMGGGGFSGT